MYGGNLVVLTQLNTLRDLVDYTRQELSNLFKPYDPEHVHEHIDPVEMAKILSVWKPRYIHSEKSKQLVRAVIEEAGFVPGDTHYDLPKPRTSFPLGHLNTGVAFAFPWHRDTWYSAPAQQINWWLPVFPVRGDNAMNFDLTKFDQPVPNTSGGFDYYENNANRLTTATGVTQEAQSRPGAVDHVAGQDVVILPAPGEVLLFSGNHLHASTPNTSGRARFSVDFRIVNVPDLLAGSGAPLVDADCTGTAVRDFVRVTDESALDEEMVVKLFGAPPADAMLVFDGPSTEA